MEAKNRLQSINCSVEMSTIVVVKNRCQFCYAFFKDLEKNSEHSQRCEFRFSETFEAADGKVKFACAVCFNVFDTRADHKKHEQSHKFPGGFPCRLCDEGFLNGLECVEHMRSSHEVVSSEFSAFTCLECGAIFEQESYLRLHIETNCGRQRSWKCNQCCPDLMSEDAYSAHMDMQHPSTVEDEGTFFEPKVVITLMEDENISPDENFFDPLHMMLKEETPSVEDAATNFIRESAGETKTENTNDRRALNASSGADYIPKIGLGEKYECKYCIKKYRSKSSLEEHIALHGPNGSLLYRCNRCNTYFETQQEKTKHSRTAHTVKVSCRSCNRSFQSVNALQKHCNKRCPKEPSCVEGDDCAVEQNPTAGAARRKNSADESMNSDHKMIGTETTTTVRSRKKKTVYKCSYCYRKYGMKKTWEKHVATHGPDGSLVFRCGFSCGLFFGTREERRAHELAAHKDKLTCKVCGKSHKIYSALYKCQSLHRNGPTPKSSFICTKCGKSLSASSYLNDHEKSDCGRIPIYKCDLCGNSFVNKHSLYRHMMVHSGKTEVKCDFCEKTLTDKVSLVKHIRYRHTGERPYKCPYCDKRFVDNANLKTHTIVHTGIKRHVCYGCGDRYPSNSALHKHRNARKDTCALVPIEPPLPIGKTEK